MIPGINESKTLIKHISCDFDGQTKTLLTIYINTNVKDQRNILPAKKIMLRILAYVVVSMINMVESMNI